MVAPTRLANVIRAVVSRGGQPDLQEMKLFAPL